MPTEIAERYMTVAEAAEVLDLTRQGVHWLIKGGKLEAVYIGRQWFIERKAVRDMIREREG